MTIELGSQSGYFENVGQEDGIFAQDTGAYNRRLTLTYGVRWDLLTHPYEAHNQQSAFNIATGQVMEAGLNGVSRSIIAQDYHAFGPRGGFAYDLRGDGKTVVRGGYGIFYFLDYGGINNQLGEQLPFSGHSDYYGSNGYCITFTGQLPTVSPDAANNGYNCNAYTGPTKVVTPLPARGVVGFNPAAPPQGLSMIAVNQSNENSQVQEWNLQVERQLGSNNVVNIAYVGTRGSHLSSYYPYNLVQFGTGKVNYPNFGNINYNNYDGISNYDGLQLHAEHRSAKGLTATFSYAWGHSLDDSTGAFQGQTQAVYYNPMGGYGNSSQDIRQIFSSSLLYHLPFGRGQRFVSNISRPMDWVVGGWQTSLTAIVQGGTPIDLSTGEDNPGNRPDHTGKIKYPKSTNGGAGSYWFDPTTSFSNPPVVTGTSTYQRLGNLGRDQVYGPGYRVVNWSMQKNIHLTNKQTLELHGDAFNLFNTPAFTNPGGGFCGDLTGHSCNVGQIEGTQVYSNRQIQLAARFTF